MLYINGQFFYHSKHFKTVINVMIADN